MLGVCEHRSITGHCGGLRRAVPSADSPGIDMSLLFFGHIAAILGCGKAGLHPTENALKVAVSQSFAFQMRTRFYDLPWE